MAEAPVPGPVKLGGSPLPLLPMALGGSFYATDAGDAERMSAMEAAYAGGIRHFDTAAGYGAGHQEELLGHFLAGRRDSAFVASKWHGDDLGAAAMLAAVEASLRRLRVGLPEGHAAARAVPLPAGGAAEGRGALQL